MAGNNLTGPMAKGTHSGGKKFDGMSYKGGHPKPLTNTMDAEHRMITSMKIGAKLNLNSNVEGVIKSFKGGAKRS